MRAAHRHRRHHTRTTICHPFRTHLKCHRRWRPSRRHQVDLENMILSSTCYKSIVVLVPTMMPLTSAGMQMSASSSVITTMSMTPSSYPQLTPLPAINNHLYQQSSMMNSDMIQSQCYQGGCLPPNMLDLIKLENSSSPHIAHTNLTRSLSAESEKNNNKALDLELKQHRQSFAGLTNIESR